jgi:hypothetical protein
MLQLVRVDAVPKFAFKKPAVYQRLMPHRRVGKSIFCQERLHRGKVAAAATTKKPGTAAGLLACFKRLN